MMVLTLMLVACGDNWTDPGFEALHAAFPLECGHAGPQCEACHDPARPPGPVDGTCLTCHESDRPDSHDPAATADCAECHTACGWDTASPHPSGFVEPDQHGLAFKIQDPTEGDCRDCHGATLAGGDAQGCDDCHTSEGIGDWRTDCVLCHGGELEASGAPPVDIDDASPVSFVSHTAHVDPSDSYRVTPCTDCHVDASDVMSDGHVFDATPGVSEVVFTGGPSDVATYAGGTCSSTHCHGPGYYDEGTATDSDPPVTCGTCHAIDGSFELMSGVHDIHLDEPGIVCHDCHAELIDAAGVIIAPERHVDGEGDVSLAEPTIATPDGGQTCEGTCHGFPHDGTGWGHPPGYDAPEIHGQEALNQTLECQSCHGNNLGDCLDCHDATWRTDCAYCHGSDSTGLPPSDLDNTTDEDQISFKAHPEHSDGDSHPLWGCDTCHGVASLSYVDALTDPGHWLDSTPGVSEVVFSGIAAGATWSASTCSNLYCHGDGRSDGSESDGTAALPCDSCHGMPPSSGDHRDHEHDRYPCTECHALTVNDADVVIGPNRHVDGSVDVDMNGTLNSITWNGTSCSGSCHGEGHSGERW